MSAPRGIRLLLSDVDGTLVTDDKVLTPEAIEAARALRERGVGLAVTSSRPPFGLRALIEPLGLRLPIAGCNGGVLVEPDLTVIETRLIDADAAARAVDFLRAMQLDVWLYTDAEWFVPDACGPHVEREAWILKTDPKVTPTFAAQQLARAVKIVGVSDDFERVADAESRAQAALGDAVSAARSAHYFLDVTNPKANKGEVVETLARRLGLAAEQIATIGDMPNDVLMFRKSGFSIAMGNASEAVKAQASATTARNGENGWAQAVRTLILPAAGAAAPR